MTHAELQSAIINAWKDKKPTDSAAALEIAHAVLADYPKERGEFSKWFEKNGAAALQRAVNV